MKGIAGLLAIFLVIGVVAARPSLFDSDLIEPIARLLNEDSLASEFGINPDQVDVLEAVYDVGSPALEGILQVRHGGCMELDGPGDGQVGAEAGVTGARPNPRAERGCPAGSGSSGQVHSPLQPHWAAPGCGACTPPCPPTLHAPWFNQKCQALHTFCCWLGNDAIPFRPLVPGRGPTCTQTSIFTP